MVRDISFLSGENRFSIISTHRFERQAWSWRFPIVLVDSRKRSPETEYSVHQNWESGGLSDVSRRNPLK